MPSQLTPSAAALRLTSAAILALVVLAGGACAGPPKPPDAAMTAPATPAEITAPATPATTAAPAQPPTSSPAPAPAPPLPADVIAVTVLPDPAYIETTDGSQRLNCDFVVTNRAEVAWTLSEVQVTVRDASGALAYRRFLDGNGVSPSITTIPNRELPAAGKILLLNPLHEFPRDVPLARLRFDFTYERADGEQTLTVSSEVTPAVYVNKAELRLPLSRRFIVWDGHDFGAHHRRWDYVFAPIAGLGFDSNAGRYSYDFVPVDETGAMSSGDPSRNESWFGFGQPIHATADGTVVAVVDERPDDRKFDREALRKDLLVVYGNYVIVDHGQGEFSLFAHLQQGSARVKAGDRVRSGQEIAAIGASGSSHMPHLHYQLQTRADGHAEGLPSYFVDAVRVRGTKRVAPRRGQRVQIDSGELVEPVRAPAAKATKPR